MVRLWNTLLWHRFIFLLLIFFFSWWNINNILSFLAIWLATSFVISFIFFWSVFSRIRTEYGETPSIFPYSVRMWENTDQNNSEYNYYVLIYIDIITMEKLCTYVTLVSPSEQNKHLPTILFTTWTLWLDIYVHAWTHISLGDFIPPFLCIPSFLKMCHVHEKTDLIHLHNWVPLQCSYREYCTSSNIYPM